MPASDLKSAVALCLFAALSACGGGSTSGQGTEGIGNPPSDFAALSNTANGLIEDYINENGVPASGLTRSTTVPIIGTATYSGYLYGVADDVELIAELELDTNFASREITGTAGSFEASSGATISGELSGDGDIVSSAMNAQPQATIVLRGTLTIAGDAADSAVALDGDFYPSGNDANGAIAGLAEGNIGGDALEDGIFGVED